MNKNYDVKTFISEYSYFKDTRREKDRQIKLQRLQKVGIREFGSLKYQINSLKEVLKLKQNFQKKME